MNISAMLGEICAIADKKYRIIGFDHDICTLCELETTKFVLLFYNINEMKRKIRNDEIAIIEELETFIIDIDLMSHPEQKKYMQRKEIMQRIVSGYGPSYAGLVGHQKKLIIEEIIVNYGIKRVALWRLIRQYLQSGLKDSALVDKRFASAPGGEKEKYNFKKKNGRPKQGVITAGVVLSDKVEVQFEEFLNDYKKGRERTFKKAYCGLIDKYYSRLAVNGVDREWLPVSERPTFNQFYYFCSKNITKQEKDIIKTSKAEQRNSKRLLLSSSRIDALRPGWIVESDALEADFSIVSELNSEQSVGRPIVYLMIDVYSSVIVAISVSFENNSVLGLTNLFLNLDEDKVEYAKRFGIEFDKRLWPSNFIPHEIRCDRGSDFKSDKFGKICRRLGITRTLEPGATGSMKGLVEQSFHQFQTTLRPEMEKKGLITYRYDSNHHREAMLTMQTFTQMLINYVLAHNQKYIKEYPMEKEMYKVEGFKPVPAIIWEYGCNKYGSPTMITKSAHTQYVYDLMIERTASLSKKGLRLNDLYYINNNQDLLDKMYNLGTKREKFIVRCDPRDVGKLYYMQNNKLCVATLNAGIPGNPDFAGMTWKEYEEYHQARKNMRIEGMEHNMQVDADLYKVYKAIVDANATESLADTTDIRESREKERQYANFENRISKHLNLDDETKMVKDVSLKQPQSEENSVEIEDDPFAPNLDLREANRKFENRRRGN